MIKGTEKAPAIRFRGFTDDWEQRKLGDECSEIVAGGDINKKNLLKDGRYPVIANALTDDGIVGYYANEYRIKAPAVTVTGRGDVGHAQARKTNFTPVVRLLSVISKHNVDFLAEAINQNEVVLESTGVPQLTVPTLANYLLRFPSTIEEEKKIGQCFSQIDHLITLHQHKLELQKKLKAFFLQNMFPEEGETVPRIRFKGFTRDWEQRKLGEIGSTFTGLSRKTKEDFGHGDARFVTYMNVYSNSIADLAMTERVEIDQTQNSVKYGDIFFTTSSETPNEVGMSSVWLGNTENTYLNSFCFGYRPEVKVNPYYMAYMLRSPNVRNKLIILAQGISRYNISKNRVMDIEVPMPDLSEQKEIGQYFFNLDNLITLHQRKIDQLQTVKKFMLQNLFI